MTGRQEHDAERERTIKRLIADALPIIQDYSYNFEGKSMVTAELYIRRVLKFAEFFEGRDLTELKKSDINRYMESIKYREKDGERVEVSATVRRAVLAAIKDFYTFLVDNDEIENNPCANIKPPKLQEPKEPIYLTPKEIKKVEHAITGGKTESVYSENIREILRVRDYAVFLLGCTTGLRRGAISEINIEDVDFLNGIITVTEKGNKQRDIHIGEKTMNALDEWFIQRKYFPVEITTDALFVTKLGKRMQGQDIGKMIKKYTEDLGKHITPHKMRSTCATNLYDKTGDIYLVQSVLGHSNIANTRRYAKVRDDKLKNAAKTMNGLV